MKPENALFIPTARITFLVGIMCNWQKPDRNFEVPVHEK